MKKLLALLTIAGMLTFGVTSTMNAQDAANDDAQVEKVDSTKTDTTVKETPKPTENADQTEAPAEEASFHQIIKDKFVEGGPEFMGIILLTLILGLALVIERIIYLNLSSTNTTKLLVKIEKELESNGVGGAKELCRSTKGPVAGIFFQGLDRYNEGIEMVEKSVVAYGSVLQGRLEKGMSWITLFIALAPMLGFMGTVIGMVDAFDKIAAAGDISPTIVAGGIKIALLTTVFGLIVAMILQIFYNYLVSKIESIVNSMEDATISFMDILVKYNSKN